MKSSVISCKNETNFYWKDEVSSAHENNDEGRLTQANEVGNCVTGQRNSSAQYTSAWLRAVKSVAGTSENTAGQALLVADRQNIVAITICTCEDFRQRINC